MSRNNWQGMIIGRPNFGILTNLIFLGVIGLIFFYITASQPNDEKKSPSPSEDEFFEVPKQSQQIDLLKMVNHSKVEKTSTQSLNKVVILNTTPHQRGSPSTTANQTVQSYVIQIAALKERNSITVLLDQYSQHAIRVVDGYDGKIRIWIVGFKTKTEAETYRRAHQIDGYIKAI